FFLLLAVMTTAGVWHWAQAGAGRDIARLEARLSNSPVELVGYRPGFPSPAKAIRKVEAVVAAPIYYTATETGHPSQMLSISIQSGDTTQVQTLIQAGADVNAIHPVTGRTPLDEALHCGDPAMIRLLETAGARPSPDA
ncbi:MAG: ankyrin repeat domain-containing protein, partial [Blastopirellula sp. JB062]